MSFNELQRAFKPKFDCWLVISVIILVMLPEISHGSYIGRPNVDDDRYERAKCSACGVVAQELLLSLDNVVQKSTSGNVEVGPDGGAVLNVAMNEGTMLNILDNVCGKMKDYVLIESENVPQFVRVDSIGKGGKFESVVGESGSSRSGGSAGGIRINNLAGGANAIEVGGGFAELTGSSLTLGGGEAAQAAWGGKRLERFCEELLGENEDAVVASIAQRAPEDLAQVLCVEPSSTLAPLCSSSDDARLLTANTKLNTKSAPKAQSSESTQKMEVESDVEETVRTGITRTSTKQPRTKQRRKKITKKRAGRPAGSTGGKIAQQDTGGRENMQKPTEEQIMSMGAVPGN